MDEAELKFYFPLNTYKYLPRIILMRLFAGRINIESYRAGGLVLVVGMFVSLILAWFIESIMGSTQALMFLTLTFLIGSFINYSFNIRRAHDISQSFTDFIALFDHNWYKYFTTWSKTTDWEFKELSQEDNKYGKKPLRGIDWFALFGLKNTI